MKRMLFFCCLCFLVIFGLSYQSKKEHTAPVSEIYYTDRVLRRLVPMPLVLPDDTKKAADEMINAIIDGKDYNRDILRLFPKKRDCITVTVSGDTAYVNLSGQLREAVPKTREAEYLAIYQIVNSLTSINGITNVRFTVDGDTCKNFLGFLDMREVFTANSSA